MKKVVLIESVIPLVSTSILAAGSGLSWEYPLSWIDLTLKSLILLTDAR